VLRLVLKLALRLVSKLLLCFRFMFSTFLPSLTALSLSVHYCHVAGSVLIRFQISRSISIPVATALGLQFRYRVLV